MAFRAALIAALPATPFVAAVFTVAAVTAPDSSMAHWWAGSEGHPVAPATFNLVVTWIVLSLVLTWCGALSVDRANTHSITSFRARLTSLKCKHHQLCKMNTSSDTDCMPYCVINTYIKEMEEDLKIDDER
jgi:hypothetical protein